MEIGADVLFWDEPHFYIERETEAWACRCRHCLERFQDRYGYPMPETLDQDVVDFKQASIVDLLDEVCRFVREKGKKNAVCLLPEESAHLGVYDWSVVARIEALDILGTDPYWREDEPDVAGYVGRYARRIQDLATRYQKESQIWILNFRIPAGTEANITRAIEAAVREGVGNLAAWCYGGAGHVSYLKSGDPQRVWDVLGEAYGRLRGGCHV
jgi:hypothetical protein